MPEQQNRIIVEGVEYHQIFAFPKIFQAVTSSLQPSRLLIALFMVVALIAVGRLWDNVTRPNVDPRGLAFGRHKQVDLHEHHQALLRQAVLTFAGESSSIRVDPQQDLDTHEALREIARGYRREHAATASERERQELETHYHTTVRVLHETRPKDDFEATLTYVSGGFRRIIDGILALSPRAVVDGVGNLLVETPKLLWHYHKWFAIVYGVVFLVIFALGGGALCRMAAVQFATGQRLTVREAIDFAMRYWGRLVWALLLPMVITAGLCVVIIAMGLLMGAPVLNVLGGVLYGLALLFGGLIAFLLIGYLLGFPMLLPAVGSENCDGADAMQRAYAYVVTRPLHLLGYWAVALVGLALGFVLVSLVAVWTLNLTASLYDTVAGSPAMHAAGNFDPADLSQRQGIPEPGPWHTRWAATAITFWQALVLCLIAAYVLAYHFGASTIVYLLMRRVCDGQDIQEIWRPGLMPGTQTPVAESPMATATPGSLPRTRSAMTAEAENEGLD